MNILAEQQELKNQPQSYPELFDLSLDPFLQEELNQAKLDAELILQNNLLKLSEERYQEVPLPIDVLGTAELVVKADNPFLRESYKRSLINDSTRLISESMRKNTWEYFPSIFQIYDAESQDFRIGRISLNKVVENGLSPTLDPEEQAIRISEYLEHKISLLVRENLIDTDNAVSLITIKECPDYVINNYQRDQQSSHGGYVPEIKKLVISKATITKEGQSFEQFALSGEYIDHQVILETLSESLAIPSDSKLTKLDLREKQFVGTGKNDELVNLIKALDQKASQKYSKNLFMGEELKDIKSNNYEELENIAIIRQQTYQEKALLVSEYLINLSEAKTDKRLAEFLLSNFVKKLLFKEVINNPDYASNIFNEEISNELKIAQELLIKGQIDEYKKAQTLIYQNAPSPSFCGAGSCGLEAVSEGSIDSRIAKSLKLKGELIKDTVRNCPNCGNRSILYDARGNKACTNCKISEIKKS